MNKTEFYMCRGHLMTMFFKDKDPDDYLQVCIYSLFLPDI